MESGKVGTIGRTTIPTLGLVVSDGSVRTSGNNKPEDQRPDQGESLASTPNSNSKPHATPVGGVSERFEESISPQQMNSTAIEFTSSEIEEVIKRPRLTLLILKEPSTEKNDYVIANSIESDSELLDEFQSPVARKKKKKKSRDKCLTMSRSYAQKLVEIQKSMLKLTAKYQTDSVDLDRRRRTQSASNTCFSEPSISLKSPPLSAPISGQIPSFLTNKGKCSVYRRRYLSATSNTETKRRFTRKKRFEEESAQAPASENAKKNHLSENNVWTPMDDYRLLVNIIQTKGNLEHVFVGTKFSCFYSFEDVVHRWETLLYDDKAGVLSQTAINNLHPVIKRRIQNEALFGEEEENLLRSVKIVPGVSPELNCFIRLLEENPQIFQHRTARKLLSHWIEMKNFHLLDGQDVRDYKDPFSLFEFQDSAYLSVLPDVSVYQELKTESKLVKHQIRQLEEELESWHCMQELVVSDGTSDLQSIFSISEFDDQTYAILRGKQVRYCMRSKEILLGRHSTNNKVDADLTLEGASGKVSRKQAVIQMKGFGEFFIINQGRHSIFVDHVHVPYGGMTKITDGCVIQITHIKLIFKINEKLVRKEVTHEIRREVLNARLKSLDPFSSNFPPVSATRPSDGVISGRYSSPRKRNASSSASNSPVLGLSGSVSSSFALRPTINRSMGPSSICMGNGVPALPFSSNGDLTIRPTSQPVSPSQFLTDFTSKHLSKTFASGTLSSDGDVFKKPAPVSGIRPGNSKSTGTRFSNVPSTSTSVSLSSPATEGTPILPGSQVYTAPPTTTTTESFNEIIQSGLGSGAPANLPPVSQLIDYTKLGLSADVTVTQRVDLPSPSATTSTPSTYASFTSAGADETATLTTIKNIETTTMPTLGLVKMEEN